MAKVRSLRSNAQNLQPVHWQPLDSPTGCCQNLNNAPNNVLENNMAHNNNNNLVAVPNQDPLSQWTANPVSANFDTGTPQGQKISDAKTRGLPEDKKFEITTMEGRELRKYLLGRQAALGGVVTCIPTERNADGTMKITSNLIKQYQLIPFEFFVEKRINVTLATWLTMRPCQMDPMRYDSLIRKITLRIAPRFTSRLVLMLFTSSWSIASLRRDIRMYIRVTRMR